MAAAGIVTVVIVTLILAWLSYLFIERPGIQLGRMLEHHLTPLRDLFGSPLST